MNTREYLAGCFIVILTCVSAVVAASDAPTPCLMEVSRLASGSSQAVQVEGNLAAFGSGTDVVLGRFKAGKGIVELGRVQVPGVVRSLQFEGRFLYVACADRGLVVLDVGNPSFPAEIGFLATGDAWDLAKVDDLVLMAAGETGVQAVDVSNPREPRPRWIFACDGNATEIEVEDGFAHVLDRSGVQVLEVNADQATQVSFYAAGRQASALAVRDGLSYVAGFDSAGLQVIDVSEPARPRLLGALGAVGGWNIVLDGELAAISNGSVALIDVSDPSRPQWVSTVSLETGYGVTAAAFEGDRVWATSHYDGIAVIDAVDPRQAQVVASLELGASPSQVEVESGLAVVHDHARTLEFIDVSQPQDPVRRSRLYFTSVTDVHVQDDVVMVADGLGGLVLIDASDLGQPEVLGGINWAWPEAVASSGYLVALSSGTHVSILDIAFPYDPEVLGTAELPATAEDLLILDGTLYAACNEAGLVVVDLSTASTPMVLAELATGGKAVSIAAFAVEGRQHLAVACRLGGLVVVDVSDPAVPVEVGRFREQDMNALSVAAEDDRAFVADWHNGLWVFDIGDPERPALLDLRAGSGIGAAVHDGVVWLAAGDNGLAAFESRYCNGEAMPPFAWFPELPTVGQLVQFISAERDPDALWWDFGDGDVSTANRPAHRFRRDGPATVWLAVEHDGGTDNVQLTVPVTAAAPRRSGQRVQIETVGRRP